MRRFSAAVSFVVASAVPALANASACAGAEEDTSGIVSAHEYNVVIDARGRQITGICLIETAVDGSIVGTVVNEFGVKAFDMEYKNGKMRLKNVFKPIDKWYIRRTLRKDMQFLFDNFNSPQNVSDNTRRFSREGNGDRRMENKKQKITYTVSEITAEH